MTLFEKDADYEALLRVLVEAGTRCADVAIMSFCVMPNHWHLPVSVAAYARA